MAEALFLYDFNSPYAYLAANRVDRVLGPDVRWQPVSLAFLLRAHDREPWSFGDDTRPPGMAECERRAREYGLPPLRWPPGWPIESYSLLPLRAAIAAAQRGRLREFSLAAFAENFEHGRGLSDPAAIARAAAVAGLEDVDLAAEAQHPDVKEALRRATDDALAAGTVGVPTVLVDGEPFWGDDRLEDAAAPMSDIGQ